MNDDEPPEACNPSEIREWLSYGSEQLAAFLGETASNE